MQSKQKISHCRNRKKVFVATAIGFICCTCFIYNVTVEHTLSPKNTMSPIAFDRETYGIIIKRSTN